MLSNTKKLEQTTNITHVLNLNYSVYSSTAYSYKAMDDFEVIVVNDESKTLSKETLKKTISALRKKARDERRNATRRATYIHRKRVPRKRENQAGKPKNTKSAVGKCTFKLFSSKNTTFMDVHGRTWTAVC